MEKFLSLLLAVAVTANGFSETTTDVVLAADGRAKACVVLAADATESETFAAAELSAYAAKLTGAKLPVGPTADAGLVPITFRRLERGETASGVRDDGYRIDVSKDGVVISARHPAGILFGVYHILNRFGGVEWFHAESGDDYEPIAALKIPEGTILRNPMPQRSGMPSGNGIAATPEIRRKCALWNVRNGFNLDQRNPGTDPEKVTPGNDYDNRTVRELGHVDHAEAGGHVLGNLVLDTPIDPKDLRAECERVLAEESARFDKPQGEVVTRYAQWRILVRKHPEWFGLVDGQRVPCGVSLRDELGFHGKSSMPCLSNLGTRAAMLANFRRWRARHPKGTPVYYRICCDDQSRWCECDACMRLLKCKGPSDDKDKASDYWWDFINWFSGEVLKDDPDLSLGVYVYRTYQTFPKKVKPVVRDRMSIVLCPHGRCYTHALNDPKCPVNGKYRDMFRIWADAGFPINAFEYMNQTPGKCNYAFWERVWIEDLKWYMSRGISHGAGGLVGPWCGYAADESYFRRNAAKARWQFGWLSGKFEWDPTLDFDTVRDEMLRRYYRTAAKPMTAYHKLLEKAFLGTGICMPYGGGGSLFAAAAATPGVMTEAARLLEEATALAGDDRELLKRLAWDREYFRTNWESAGISAAGHAVTPMARTVDPITVDGRLDEKTWIAAQPMDDFRHVVTIRDTPRKPEEAYDPPAKLRTAWDAENLYLAFTCAKADGKVVDAADDGSTFVAMRGTHVEFMVTAPALKGRYYHAAISHAGRAYSALTENGKMRDLTKKLPMKFAVADAPDAWTVEVAIPLAAFGGAKEGDLWKIDASVASADKKGKIRGYGSLCGYGLHLPDYWPIVSFGQASDLFRNGGFETLGAPPPKGEGGKFLNGRNWTFLSDRVPTEWFYQQNGGTAEAVKGDAAEGETYLRLTPPAKGSPLFLLQELNAYPASATKLTMSFFARGKGEVKAVSLHSRPGEKQLVSQPVRLDSAEWKRYSVELPLEGGHPYKMMFRLQSFGNPVDVDGLELK